MPQANPDPTTPDLRPPATTAAPGDTLPSIADIYALMLRLSAAHERWDPLATFVGDDMEVKTDRRAKAAKQIAYDRRETLATLALTLPARTIQDAAAQLILMDDRLHCLNDNDQSEAVWRETTCELLRGMASVLPIVARAAGTTLNDLLGYKDYMVDIVLPDVGEGTR